ncbi:MAG: SRPBCC family protein [Allobranchiibius sp.]
MTDDKKIVVQRQIDEPAQVIFDVLTDPRRHVALDGSGFVRGADNPQRITKVGDKFSMDMEGDHMGGDYQTDNFVSAYDENKMIGWKTAPAGTEPPGWEWLWELRSEGSDSTMVSLTYDWSKVTDKDLLSKLSFPLIPEKDLENSLGNLASAVSDVKHH